MVLIVRPKRRFLICLLFAILLDTVRQVRGNNFRLFALGAVSERDQDLGFLLAGYYEINVVESHVSLSLCWLNEIKSHAKDSFSEFKAHFSLAKAEIKTISNCGLQFPNCPLIQCNAI